jgi:hypothetical protein
MRKALSGILLGILSLMFIITTAGSSNAAITDLAFGKVGYNAPGNDVYDNRNKEYVDIKNTSLTSPVSVKGLKIQDSWAKARPDYTRKCNNFTVDTLVSGITELPVGYTLRVYTGSGTPAVNTTWKYYYLYMDMPNYCGWNGHIYGNMEEIIWLSINGQTVSKSWNFKPGYYVN